MRARTTMTGLALTAGLALSMAPAGLASAGAPSADRATTSVVSHKAATTKAEQQRVEDYWTPARMKNAIPVGVKVKPTKGKPGGGTAGATAVAETPQPRFGKVFFTERQLQLRLLRHGDQQRQRRRGHHGRPLRQRGPASSSPTSPSCRRTTTAPRPTAPGPRRTLLTTDEWKNGEDYDYDAGFAVMNENAAGPEPDRGDGGG